MIQRISSFFVKLVEKYLPDPFLFVVILTIIVFLMGIGIAGNTPLEMVVHWGQGFWNLLAFSMQMVLVLVTGHTLASSPLFKKILRNISKTVETPAKAIMLTSFIS